MQGFIKGYICRSKNSNKIIIAIGSKPPEIKEKTGWYWYIPGWFATLSIYIFKKKFGFFIKPGTYEPINISISEIK